MLVIQDVCTQQRHAAVKHVPGFCLLSLPTVASHCPHYSGLPKQMLVFAEPSCPCISLRPTHIVNPSSGWGVNTNWQYFLLVSFFYTQLNSLTFTLVVMDFTGTETQLASSAGTRVNTIVLAFTAIAGIFVFLRLFARFILTRVSGFDDVCIILAMVRLNS
jgi:hypothetical protein